jgi:hypothetical protein
VTSAPPVGFFLCLGGATVGGAAVLWAVHRALRARPLARRLRVAASDARASTIVEFPFALLTLVVVSLLTWQLALMASAYLVIDYAAYAAARCAIVSIPEDRSDDDDDEGPNEISTSSSSPKNEDIREAAMFACYPIAGLREGSGGSDAGFDLWREALEAAEGLGIDAAMLELSRYLYLKEHTSFEFLEDVRPEGEYSAGDLVHVRVRHRYQLRVPFASRILGTADEDWGYGTMVDSEATMLVETYPEQTPPGAPDSDDS